MYKPQEQLINPASIKREEEMEYTKMIELILPIFCSTVVAIAGWFFVSWLAWKRDVRQKKKDLRITHLISAYHNIRNFEDDGISTKEDFEKFRKMIQEVYLLGSKEIIDAVDRGLSTKNGNEISITDLNLLIVREIREELGLDFYPEKIGKSMSWTGE